MTGCRCTLRPFHHPVLRGQFYGFCVLEKTVRASTDATARLRSRSRGRRRDRAEPERSRPPTAGGVTPAGDDEPVTQLDAAVCLANDAA